MPWRGVARSQSHESAIPHIPPDAVAGGRRRPDVRAPQGRAGQGGAPGAVILATKRLCVARRAGQGQGRAAAEEEA